ncbi:MAG: SagB/ThcOx family dehydrogenase [Fretibacterium sp.]|nr:SagB/ThcOx family dehydrogenase [Fretibacterium sp.]
MRKFFALVLAVTFVVPAAWAGEALPVPEKTGGMSLLQALSERHSSREFADTDLTPQQLSNLLWATAGVNRADGKRVYPVALGIQDTFVYVLNRKGVYKYDPAANVLTLIEKGDHRMETTLGQNFVGRAAVNLAYVHDTSLWEGKKTPEELIHQWGFVHTGAAVQNAYLYAASQGWNAVVRGSFDQEKLSGLLKLSKGQSVMMVQSIGPKP